MTLVELQALAKRLGMPGFASKQIASWLYEKKVTSIDEMTNLSLKHRELQRLLRLPKQMTRQEFLPAHRPSRER